MTLRARVIAIVAGLVVAGIGAVSLVAYTLADRELTAEADRFLRDRAGELVEGVRPPPGERNRRGDGDGRDGDGRGDDDVIDFFDADAIVQTLDRSGDVVVSGGGTLPVDADDVDVAQGGRTIIRDVEIDGEPFRMITTFVGGDGGAVQVARSTDSADSVLSELGWRFAVLGAVLAALAAVAGWLLMRRATKPLEDLTAATERVTATRDLTPLRLDRTDEVGRLADSFDEMLLALSASREQQRRLVQDAGHELRTPLTSLRANIEFLEHAPTMPDHQRAAVLAGLRSETEELGLLVTEVIALASGDADDARPDTELDLADVVTEAVERFRRRHDREVTLTTEPTPLLGNVAMLDRAVTNLLGNAHKFSHPDRPIEVGLTDRTLSVRDHGPGIDPAELDRVFDRFYRSDAARSQPGSGLGLAIVQKVAETHGGSAGARNAPDGGAIVSLTLP
ncbi:MAG: HAMP domain-containing sensor histidine kinase [Ilumatobacter sp.]|uniref:sensor histidine kinase n=1 Tax=Ilumatobacter sp. TaxID=1967498 RepID=UPI00260BD78A|nr:HAMP domain-containing sensor histidine kinase [Ilumatobacter sp.]MDJ0771389.1 HAMP domain-containing sensor histidine kinase [Ilumatobacter sp.]